MNKSIQPIVICLCFFLGASLLQAGDVDFGININIGNTPKAPHHPTAQVYIEEPPVFIFPPSLGFYIAIGIPYDMFYIDNHYYMYRENMWYVAPNYNGPWGKTHYRHIPKGLRRHKHGYIVKVRDEEYRNYKHQKDRYHGKHFRPGKHELKEMRKEDKMDLRQERKESRDKGYQGHHGK
ncbi:MAG: hypothetical protein HQK76_08275 [Desulfobacterales bacterium]|nr:hypothetical protein [Desulfobacterales bacterium]